MGEALKKGEEEESLLKEKQANYRSTDSSMAIGIITAATAAWVDWQPSLEHPLLSMAFSVACGSMRTGFLLDYSH